MPGERDLRRSRSPSLSEPVRVSGYGLVTLGQSRNSPTCTLLDPVHLYESGKRWAVEPTGAFGSFAPSPVQYVIRNIAREIATPS